jgi:hypothetical protein
MTWRDSAIQYIAAGLLEYSAQQLCMDFPVDPVMCQKWLNKECYPFGPRSCSPYAIWLQETKRTIYFWQASQDPRDYPSWRSNLGRAPQKGRKLAIAAEATGQIKLSL